MSGTPLPRGITLFDLVTAIPQSTEELFPSGVRRVLEHLSVVTSHSRASATFDIVEGTVRSVGQVVDEIFGFEIGDGFIAELPGVSDGLPFEYSSVRAVANATQNVEPAPALWQVSISVDRVLVRFPGRAARRTATTDENGTGFVGELVPDPDRERSHIWVSGTVLITNVTAAGNAGNVYARVIAPTDPFAPNSPSGMILRAGLEPRHVLFGTTGFGMTVGEIEWDATPAVTSPEIVARGHDAAWQGISVSDATLYLPRDLPFVGDVTAGVRDLLIGRAPDNGVQLEAFVQLGNVSRLDLGDDDADKVTLSFYQDVDGQIDRLDTPDVLDAADGIFPVDVTSTDAGDPVRVMARLDQADASARWKLPGTDAWVTANDTGWLTVRPGDPKGVLGYRDIFELEDGGVADGLERTYGFVVGAPPADGGFPPTIEVTLEDQAMTSSFTWADVTKLSGTRDQLALVRFAAGEPVAVDEADVDRITWSLAGASGIETASGQEFTPSVYWRTGLHQVVLTDHVGRHRRLDIEILDAAPSVLVGCAHAVGSDPIDDRLGPRQFVDDGLIVEESRATALGVVATYHLRGFHQDGDYRPAAEPARLDANEPNGLSIPSGSLAEVTVGEPGTTHVLSAMRVLMDFDSKTPTQFRRIHPVEFDSDVVGFEGRFVDPWGPVEPYPPFPDDPTHGGDDRLRGFASGVDSAVSAAAELRSWAHSVLAVDSAASFVVVGRTCDIGDDSSVAGSYNGQLATNRAERAEELLTSAEFGEDRIAASAVVAFGETSPPSSGLPADPTPYATATDPDLEARSLSGRTREVFRIVDHYPDRSAWGEDRDRDERIEARCADVYAVVTYPPATVLRGGSADAGGVAPSLRRTLVPGSDQWAVVTEPIRERRTDFAFRLLAKWDSPSWVDATDSAPTLIEAALDWVTTDLEVPAFDGSVTPAPADPGADADAKVWQVLLRYTSDPRTRQMTISGALDTPGDDTGIARLADPDEGDSAVASLALALALGPALGTGIDDDSNGSLLTLAGLAGVFAANSILGVAENGEVILHRLEFGYGRNAGGASTDAATRVWLYADYTAGFDIDVEGFITGTGIVIGYDGVGIELGDNASTAGLDDLGVVYDGPAEIVSPGVWEMNAGLAKLIGVAAVRMGAGSIWVETDLEMAIDLGPITLDAATLRLTFDAPVVLELRGLALSIDIPGVLSGSGNLAVTESSDPNSDELAVSAGLDLRIEPIGLGVDADFLYDDAMVHLEIAVTFATPIPLLNTGLGLFGLQGRFVSNGTRNLDEAPPDETIDPVERELAWLVKPFSGPDGPKYRPERGQTAIGIGATVGTATDTGFSFNVNGMLTIEFPDPSVVLTVAGRFMSLPEDAKEDGNPETTLEAALLGIVAINSDGIAVGIRGTLDVPGLLRVSIPVSAWFPFPGGDVDVDAYVRIGSDGAGGRAGDPATIVVLPGTLDLTAWSYLMIEAKQMLLLGGKADWNFFGFSIGFGCGYDFEWGGKAVSLRAGASIVVGVGTKPLHIRGMLEAGGELRFGPVGVSIDGLIELTLTEDTPTSKVHLSGEFCGEVDLALFKAKGCVKIEVGSESVPEIEPDPLVSGAHLVDRYARIVAPIVEVTNGGAAGDEETGWVDARPTLHFSKRVLDGLDPTSIQPTPSTGWGADWAGSARSKFLYRLTSIKLIDGDGHEVTDAVDWPSTWWLPSARPAIPIEGDTPSSEHEGWDLGLFTWDLAPWARSLPDGGTGSEGDPASMIERLCDPVPQIVAHHVYGANGVRQDPETVLLSELPSGPLPWPTFGSLSLVESVGVSLDAGQVWADLLGYRYTPGDVITLPEPYTLSSNGVELTEAWALPAYTHSTLLQITAGAIGSYSADVDEPDLVVALSLPVPQSGSELEICSEFEELADFAADLPNPLDVPEELDFTAFRIRGHERVDHDDDGYQLTFYEQLEIDVGGTHLMVTYGPASSVTVVVAAWATEPITMRAFDEAGLLLSEVSMPDGYQYGELFSLSITHDGIARVEIGADPLDPNLDWWMQLHSICFVMEVAIDAEVYRQSLVDFFARDAELIAPACTGTRLASEEAWDVELVDVLSSPERVAALVRYAPPPGAVGAWTGLRLDASAMVDVAVVSSCFVTTSVNEAAEANSDARDELVDGWNAMSSDPQWTHLLDADATYRVEIGYDVATWTQASGDRGVASPPSASTLDWSAPPASVGVVSKTQTFEFRTAPEATMPEEDLLRYDRQRLFDFRALARYIAGFDPPDPSIPFFLDDKLLVHFEVDWIEELLDRYDHDLRLDVVRTDPPPGTGTTFADRLVRSEIVWSSHTSTVNASPADATMAVAVLAAPCIEGPPRPAGITACIDAELEPEASYDLVVRAVPQGFPNVEGTTIARTQFRTSRYADADELFADLAFDRHADGPDPFFPFEHIVSAPAPTDVVLANDVALDEALASMGVDHLPIPEESGVLVLWYDDGSEWTVAAVLIDSLETIERPPRLEDILDDSPPSGILTAEAVLVADALAAVVDSGGVVTGYVEPPDRLALESLAIGADELVVVRSNAASTRLLAVGVAAPFVPGAALLEMTWRDRGRLFGAERYVADVPRLVSQEWS